MSAKRYGSMFAALGAERRGALVPFLNRAVRRAGLCPLLTQR